MWGITAVGLGPALWGLFWFTLPLPDNYEPKRMRACDAYPCVLAARTRTRIVGIGAITNIGLLPMLKGLFFFELPEPVHISWCWYRPHSHAQSFRCSGAPQGTLGCAKHTHRVL